jgi:hypothetical protein
MVKRWEGQTPSHHQLKSMAFDHWPLWVCNSRVEWALGNSLMLAAEEKWLGWQSLGADLSVTVSVGRWKFSDTFAHSLSFFLMLIPRKTHERFFWEGGNQTGIAFIQLGVEMERTKVETALLPYWSDSWGFCTISSWERKRSLWNELVGREKSWSSLAHSEIPLPLLFREWANSFPIHLATSFWFLWSKLEFSQ